MAQQNLDFEALDAAGKPVGWVGGDAATNVETDGVVAGQGSRSLRVTRTRAGATRLAQRVPAAQLRLRDTAAQRLRLRGLVRAPQGVAPAIWLRLDGPGGPLFLDSYGYGREPSSETEGLVHTETVAVRGWQRYEVELPLPLDVTEIAFGVAVRGAGSAWFDGLELAAVASDSWPPAAPAAVRYLDAALALMSEHALRRGEVSWPAIRAAALEHARGAETPADTHLALRFALRELGDRHSYLQSARVSRSLAAAAVSNARTGSPPALPQGQPLLENLAYLDVPGFAGGTPTQQVEFAEALRDIIEDFDVAGACGWVVDLRRNSGGNLWPMLAGLGPLLGEGEVAASVYPDGRRVAVWSRDGQAGFGEFTQLRVRAPYRVSDGVPVAVLLGPGTASSAEVLAVAFDGRGQARSFGAPTRGLSAGNRTFPLADGASLVLTVAATSDAAGRVVMGPLSPDEPAGRGPADDLPDARDAALEAASAWLKGHDSCR